MTPEEAKEKFGIKEPSANEEKGYVYCDECQIFQKTCEYCGSGYDDCWEKIAKSTGWEPEEEKKSDAVNHPKHYQGKYECIDEMISMFADAMSTNIDSALTVRTEKKTSKKRNGTWEN